MVSLEIKDVEEGRARRLNDFSLDSSVAEGFPVLERCERWLKVATTESTEFSQFYTKEFEPKLQEEIKKLEEQVQSSRKTVQKGERALSDVSEVVKIHLKALLKHLQQQKRPKSHTESTTNDPWLDELSIRHHAAKFLEVKTAHLDMVLKLFNETRQFHHRLWSISREFSDEFFGRLSQVERLISAETNRTLQRDAGRMSQTADGVFSFDHHPFSPTSSSSQQEHQQDPARMAWNSAIKSSQLDYEWRLECPPLDGFLFGLFNFLKSQISSNHPPFEIKLNDADKLPRLISDDALRTGFLQRPSNGILLTRTWQPVYAILQKSTGFLHIYKASAFKGTDSGSLLFPSVANGPFSKNTLQDMQLLTLQFLTASSHHPAGLSHIILSPSLSIKLTNVSAIASAIDPNTFSFVVKLAAANDKFTFRAFGEEDFVDWIISINSTANPNSPSRDLNASETSFFSARSHTETATGTTAAEVGGSCSTAANEASSESSSPPTAVTVEPGFAIEDPWS